MQATNTTNYIATYKQALIGLSAGRSAPVVKEIYDMVSGVCCQKESKEETQLYESKGNDKVEKSEVKTGPRGSKPSKSTVLRYWKKCGPTLPLIRAG